MAMELLRTAQCIALCRSSAPLLRSRRRNLLLGSACGAALALAAPVERADAQAFQGTDMPAGGSYERITDTNTETIQLFSESVVINWTQNDREGTGKLDFLPVRTEKRGEGKEGGR